MARTSKTFRPRFDTLEARFCMSADLDGRALIITGNSQANTVVVTQDDDEDKIFVVENNGAAQEFDSSDVDFIEVFLKAGADRLTFKLGDDDFKRDKLVIIDLGAGDDTADFKLDKQSDGGNARIEAELDITLAGRGGDDKVSAIVGKLEGGRFKLDFSGDKGNDSGLVALVGELVASSVEVDMFGGTGNDSLTVGAVDDLGVNSELDINLKGESGFDTAVTAFNGELDGSLIVRSDGGTERDVVVANLITEGDSDGQLDVIIRGGANFIIPGSAPLFDIVQLSVAVDADEVDVINQLQLQD